MAATAPAVARSLAEAFALRASLTSLLLSRSPDLVCNNIMCEKVTMGCACKLALSLGRLQRLRVLDISRNRLPVLPDSLWQPPVSGSLEELDVSGNLLRALPPDLARLGSLATLDATSNGLHASAVPWEALAGMALLRRLRILDGNDASCGPAAAALQERVPGLEIS